MALAIMNGPFEVDVDGVAPGVGVDLVEFFARADEHVADVLHAGASVVDEAVHRALRAGEIEELAHGRLTRRQIGHRHAHAGIGETERHGPPEAARASGHDHGQNRWRNTHGG